MFKQYVGIVIHVLYPGTPQVLQKIYSTVSFLP